MGFQVNSAVGGLFVAPTAQNYITKPITKELSTTTMAGNARFCIGRLCWHVAVLSFDSLTWGSPLWRNAAISSTCAMTLVGQASTTATSSFARVCMASALTLIRVWALCPRYKVRYLQIFTSPLCLGCVLKYNIKDKINSASLLSLFLCLFFSACESMADTLYNTVWTLGCRPYMNSQRAACVCEGEERDELWHRTLWTAPLTDK